MNIRRLKSYAFIVFALIALSACRGDDGDDGAPGAIGETGAQGPQGEQGPAGADGQDGSNGQNGSNGQDGSDGSDGSDGQDGQDGQDGNSYVDYYNDFNDGSLPGMSVYGDNSPPWGLFPTNITGNDVAEIVSDFAAGNNDINDNEFVGLSMQLTAEIDMVVEFDAWISSEATWDYLRWFINDQQFIGISGDGGPFHFTFLVPAGTDSIAWHYTKDVIESAGDDRALIDNIRITNYASTGRYNFGNPQVPQTVKFIEEEGQGTK